jgi:hypothetical protein
MKSDICILITFARVHAAINQSSAVTPVYERHTCLQNNEGRIRIEIFSANL